MKVRTQRITWNIFTDELCRIQVFVTEGTEKG